MEDVIVIIQLAGWLGILLLVIFSKSWRSRKSLLALAVLWMVVKAMSMSRGISARDLDVTNPSLMGIVGVGSLVAYVAILVGKGSRRKKVPEAGKGQANMPHNE